MRRSTRVLVLGATGSTGRRVAEQLRAEGHETLPASRTGDVRFDWTDETTWDDAVTGATAMYLMAPHELPVAPAFVARAVELGIRRIVLLSSMAIEAMGDERLLAAERTVRNSGVEWTILRANWFNQNFDEGVFREAVMAGQLAVPVGDLRQPFVDAGDIAGVAVQALVGDGHAGQSYDVTGPHSLSFGDAVEIVGRAAGRTVRFLGGADDYLAAMGALGFPREQLVQEVEAFAALRDLGDIPPSDVVERITGRPPKDFTSFAVEAAARGAWT